MNLVKEPTETRNHYVLFIKLQLINHMFTNHYARHSW